MFPKCNVKCCQNPFFHISKNLLITDVDAYDLLHLQFGMSHQVFYPQNIIQAQRDRRIQIVCWNAHVQIEIMLQKRLCKYVQTSPLFEINPDLPREILSNQHE